MTEMTDLSTGCSVQDRSLSGKLRGSLEEMVSLKAFTKSSCSFRNIFVIFVLAVGCVTNSVTNMIIKANKESDFWSCRSCGGNYESQICLVSYKQSKNLCILKVIRSSSFKQRNSKPSRPVNDGVYLKRLTLFVSLLGIIERFSSTFSVKMAISDALKFCLRALRETAGEAIL